MPTITTTVTSAHADGRCVTETSTESTPDASAAASTPGLEVADLCIKSWMAGKFSTIEGIAECMTEDCFIDTVDSEDFPNIPFLSGTYKGHAAALKWCNLVGEHIDFGTDMHWMTRAGETANIGYGQLKQQFGSVATGKKTGVTMFTVEFHAGPDGKIAGVRHYCPSSLNACFPASGGNIAVAQKVLAGWAAGHLKDPEKVKDYVTDDCKLFFANEGGIFHDYGGAGAGHKGMNEWAVNCDQIDFHVEEGGLNWSWAEGSDFASGKLVNQKYTCKATGKSVTSAHSEIVFEAKDGKCCGINHYFNADFNACF